MLSFIVRVLEESHINKSGEIKAFVELMHTVDEIKRQHTYTDKTGVVAHFTRFQTIEEMLPIKDGHSALQATNHLRLYNIEYLNDPHEGHRIFQRMKESASAEDNSLYKVLFEGFDHTAFIPLIHEDLSIYVCSFTNLADRLDLWRAYGQDGQGVCITIPVSAFDGDSDYHALGEHFREVQKPRKVTPLPSADTSNREPVKYVQRVLYRVKYEDPEIDKTLTKLRPRLRRIAKLISQRGDEVSEAVRKCTVALLCDILFLYKNQEYKSEGEARLVYAAGIHHQTLNLDAQSPGKIFARTDNFLFLQKDSSIIIGPTVRHKKVVELNIKFRLSRHGFNRTVVKHSQVDYRLG